MTTQTDILCARAGELAAFHAERGAWPRSRADDPDEKRLGGWLRSQRKTFRGGAMPAERRELLDTVAPGWDGTDPESLWRERADAVGRHRAAHGEFPRALADSEEERRLNSWLAFQRKSERQGKPIFTPERLAYLDAQVPGWRGGQEREDAVWLARLESLILFRAEHERWPRSSGDEAPLAVWLSNQRQRAAGTARIPLAPEREAALDSRLTGWRGVGVTRQPWSERFDALASFLADHERLPNALAGGERERSLAVWLRQQRYRASGSARRRLEPEREAALDARILGWREAGKNDANWTDRLDDLVGFLAAQGRWPSHNTGSRHEKTLYRWVLNQRSASRGTGRVRWTPEREAALDSRAPGWRG